MNLVSLEELDQWSAENPDTEAAYIKPASVYIDDLVDFFHAPPETRTDKHLPWGKAHGCFDIRPGEVTMWMGYNGEGKSLALGQVILSLMNQGDKALIASLEMRPVSTLARMARQASQSDDPAIGYIRVLGQWLASRLWLYDQHGTISPERAINLVRYSIEKLQVEHVVIDSLMKVVGSEDDYNGQKAFVDELCVRARDSNTHIHLIHHARKPAQGMARKQTRFDAKGSGAISDLVDNVVIVSRCREKQADEDPDAYLTVDKQRHDPVGGNDDLCIPLWYHAKSQQLTSCRGLPMRLIDV